MSAQLTARDREAVEAFGNFLSWGTKPGTDLAPAPARPVPPAWFAYAFGLTTWCPPEGEL